jgi:hypothetical protein
MAQRNDLAQGPAPLFLRQVNAPPCFTAQKAHSN